MKCIVHGRNLNALVDSGAGCSIISKSIFDKLHKHNGISRSDKILVDASGNDMNVMGTTHLQVKVVGTKHLKTVVFFVCVSLA